MYLKRFFLRLNLRLRIKKTVCENIFIFLLKKNNFNYINDEKNLSVFFIEYYIFIILFQL